VSCRTCPAGTSAGVAECDECGAGLFSLDGFSQCVKCPECSGPRCPASGSADATCTDGVLNMNGFYWTQPLPSASLVAAAPDVQTPTVHRCVLLEACNGLNQSSLLPLCAAGYTGPLCKSCAPGYRKNLGEECSLCRDAIVTSVLAVTVGACVALALGWLIFRYRDVLPMSSFKVVVTAAQIVAAGEALFSPQWPPPFSTFVSTLRVLLLQFAGLMRASCSEAMSFYTVIIGTMVAFKLVVVLILCHAVVHKSRKRVRSGRDANFWAACRHLSALEVFKNAFHFLLFCYIGISITLFRGLECERVGEEIVLLVRRCALLCGAVRCGAVQCSAVQCCAVLSG